MRKTLIKRSILFCIIFLLFLSCGKQDKVKIGFLFPNMVSDRYLKEKVYFSQRLQELGGEAMIQDANYDDKVQINQAKELIKNGAKVLIVNCLNLNTEAAIIRDAHAKNVKVIAYDRLIRNCDLDYYLSFDNEKVGKLMVDYVTKLRPNGNYVLLCGDKGDQNAVFVKKGQLDALAPSLSSKKINISYNVFVEDWSGDNARNAMKKFLDLSGEIPDVVLSSYDGMSTGVIDLFKAYNIQPGRVLMTGQDAELAACRNIVQGYQTMTIYKSVKTLAYKAADVAMKISKNEKIADATGKIWNGQIDVPAILLEPATVDINSLKTTVIADGFHTASEIYGK